MYTVLVVETYRQIGWETSWTFSAMAIAVALIIALGRSVKVKKPTITAYEITIIAFGVLLLVVPVPVPVSVSLPGFMLVCIGGNIFLHRNATEVSNRYRIGLGVGAVVVALGAYFAMTRMADGYVVLKDSSVEFKQFDDVRQVPREGLRVNAMSSGSSWLYRREKFSWTSFSNHDLGPSISGSDLFWGPNGLVTGDDLGRRIADWSGAEVLYRD